MNKLKERAPDFGSQNPEPFKVAYVMSRFPTLTETFILYEMTALERMGVCVEVYPLLHSGKRVDHPESQRMTRRAHFHPFVSGKILRANWHYMRRYPGRYFRLLLHVLRHTWGSANFFIGAIGIFPKSVRFAYEMERAGIDHVHTHFVNHPAVAGLIVTRLTGIPFSFTAHGFDLHVDRRMLPQKVEAAAFGVTISEYNKEMIIRECGSHVREKIHVIHCGIDSEVFKPGGPAENPPFEACGPKGRGRGFQSTGRPMRIICVGSLIDVKGHRYLIEACGHLNRRGVDFVCDLIGEGRLRQQLMRQIEQLGLKERVRLHGGKPRPAVAQMMSEADVAVLASVQTKEGKREGIPVVLMEAMASGLPVVSSRQSGIPELVAHGRTGFLAPPRDSMAIADALERLSSDASLRARMGREGRVRVLQEFNLERNAEKLLSLFLRQTIEEVSKIA